MANRQERVVELFEKNTYCVVNIFDVTLRPTLNVTGMVEVNFIDMCRHLISIFSVMLIKLLGNLALVLSWK